MTKDLQVTTEKAQVVDAFQDTHDSYFRLLIENYPTRPSDGLLADFGPPELCALAIEAQACAIALGPSALRRLVFVGFDVLYQFDNPVDFYNWRVYVKNNHVDHTTYASIAIRIDSEIKRMRRVLQLGGEEAYEALPPNVLLVSKDRYRSTATTEGSRDQPALPLTSSVQIETLNINNAIDSRAMSTLETLEKKTAVWSNVSTVISALRPLLGS